MGKRDRQAAAPASVATPAPTERVRSPVGEGDHVWYAEKLNGRSTEHLALVLEVVSETALKLKVRDNGEDRIVEACEPWGPNSTQGWWRV